MLYKVLHAKTKPRIQIVWLVNQGFELWDGDSYTKTCDKSLVEGSIHPLLKQCGMNFKELKLKQNCSF